MPNTRGAQPECPTCRAHLTAVVASGGHLSPGEWLAYLEHRASPGCGPSKPPRRRASRRLVRQRS